jgi:WD40 repeat protein
MTGEQMKGSFEGLEISDCATESNFIKSNGMFTAIPWKTRGGGVLSVVNAYDYKRLDPSIPLLRGHAGPLPDFEFAPFNPNLLCTASEDGLIKMWLIPEGGLTQDTEDCDGELAGHTKKLTIIKFHPSADYTLASCAADNTVKIWDVSQQTPVHSFETAQASTSLEWSANGSLLGTVTKGKQVICYDPRKEGEALSGPSHEGARQQKMVWAGDNETIITTGFSKTSERQFAVYDIKNMSEPLEMRRLDDSPGVAFPFFDADHKVFYVAGKGEIAINYY